MYIKPIPPAEELRKLFAYNQDGKLERVTMSGGRKPGAVVGWPQKNGYWYCSTPLGRFAVHRIIFCIVSGYPPTGEIDHINGNRSDNRFENLRDCTRSQNRSNSRLRYDNKARVKGVAPHGNRFVSHICLGGKKKHLGVFDTKEDAHEAYLNAAKSRSGEFAFGGLR